MTVCPACYGPTDYNFLEAQYEFYQNVFYSLRNRPTMDAVAIASDFKAEASYFEEKKICQRSIFCLQKSKQFK